MALKEPFRILVMLAPVDKLLLLAERENANEIKLKPEHDCESILNKYSVKWTRKVQQLLELIVKE